MGINSNPRVLVTDDERIIADSLAMILSRAGFDAHAAYSGEMMIEMARNFHPDMIVTDVIMTGISGIDAAIKVREMLPSCNILLFSGQATTVNLLQEARSKGYDFAIIAKPVHPHDLIARLKSVLYR